MEAVELKSINTSQACALVVDDDPSMQLMLEAQLQGLGYKVLLAASGPEAMDILDQKNKKIDVMLLDREMPKMNGLEVVVKMKDNPAQKNIPIIMLTASSKPEQIKQAIDAGVFYYLIKPIDGDVLKSVLSAAVREVYHKKVLSSELRQHKTSFNLIDTCSFRFQTLQEAESLACFAANCFPDPDRVVSGLAELMINALEHGSLGITYDEKTELVKNRTWRDEVIRRASLPEFKGTYVEAFLRRVEGGVQIRISDQGKGFEWSKYLQIDPARAQDNHGRGIAQANAVSFDKLKFNKVGNEVVAFVSNEPGLEW